MPVEDLFVVFDRVLVSKRASKFTVEIECFEPQGYACVEAFSLQDAIALAIKEIRKSMSEAQCQ